MYLRQLGVNRDEGTRIDSLIGRGDSLEHPKIFFTSQGCPDAIAFEHIAERHRRSRWWREGIVDEKQNDAMERTLSPARQLLK